MGDTAALGGTLGALGALLGLAIGYIIYLRNTRLPIAGPAGPNVFLEWVTTYGVQIVSFLPMALVLFGFFVDAINQDFRYSIASIIGLSSVAVNWGLSKLLESREWLSTTPASINPFTSYQKFDICTVPGFEKLESVYAPQSIVLSVAIFMYFLIDFARNRSPSQNIGLGVLFALIPVVIGGTMMKTDACKDSYFFRGAEFYKTILTAIVIGTVFGYLSWQTVSIVAPGKLPSAINQRFTVRENFVENPVIKGSKGSTAKPGDPGVGTCSAPNDQDQFVCEAYKNGKLVTTTIAE